MAPIPSFDPATGTILLHIDAIPEPKELADFASKNHFQRKAEHHITIVGFKLGKEITESAKGNPEITKKIESAFRSQSWDFSVKPFYYHVSKDFRFMDVAGKQQSERRESIVVLADVPVLDVFYKEFSTIMGRKLDEPFPHVTLYTKGTDPERSLMGIGINGVQEWETLKPRKIEFKDSEESKPISRILVPSRPQPDTIVSVFILKTFGKAAYPGIEKADLEVTSSLPAGATAVSMLSQGALALDMAGGDLDHHGKNPPVTCSELVAVKLGVKDEPALAKLLEYARRDDIVGKGTVSSDTLDRAFGLSGLIAAMNKTRPGDAPGIVRDVLPLIQAHYSEEVKRTKELPEELDKITKAGKTDVFEVKQRDKKLSVIILESDNLSMPGYLRSQIGGRYDVVVQRMTTGHTNVLTRPVKRVDLRSLALVLRLEEGNQMGLNLDKEARYLAQAGRIQEVPNWYFDDATNSIQNGGANPKDTAPTKIDPFVMRKLIEAGLSEAVWSPMQERR